jgi:hypothetical protein
LPVFFGERTARSLRVLADTRPTFALFTAGNDRFVVCISRNDSRTRMRKAADFGERCRRLGSPSTVALAARLERPMTDTSQVPDRYVVTEEAARFLRLSGRTLEKHRTSGTGPVYRKIGGRVVYAVPDLQAWADGGAQVSTSDPRRGGVAPPKGRPAATVTILGGGSA